MIARHPSNCRCCTVPAAATPVAPEPIALPDVPTPIRVYSPGAAPFDCTLHPDGTLTAVLGGELRRNFMSFADMRERGWASARIEFDPPPLVEEPVPEAVQDAIPLDIDTPAATQPTA
jgi:hypothetical protein